MSNRTVVVFVSDPNICKSTSGRYWFHNISWCFYTLYSTKNFQYDYELAAGKKGKKGSGKAEAPLEKVVVPAETDPHKLVNYLCGSNIYVDGEDVKVRIVLFSSARHWIFTIKILIWILFSFGQIKPESEYPDWLFQIHVGDPKKLEELDSNTKQYWRKLRTAALRRNNIYAKNKKF